MFNLDFGLTEDSIIRLIQAVLGIGCYSYKCKIDLQFVYLFSPGLGDCGCSCFLFLQVSNFTWVTRRGRHLWFHNIPFVSGHMSSQKSGAQLESSDPWMLWVDRHLISTFFCQYIQVWSHEFVCLVPEMGWMGLLYTPGSNVPILGQVFIPIHFQVWYSRHLITSKERCILYDVKLINSCVCFRIVGYKNIHSWVEETDC